MEATHLIEFAHIDNVPWVWKKKIAYSQLSRLCSRNYWSCDFAKAVSYAINFNLFKLFTCSGANRLVFFVYSVFLFLCLQYYQCDPQNFPGTLYNFLSHYLSLFFILYKLDDRNQYCSSLDVLKIGCKAIEFFCESRAVSNEGGRLERFKTRIWAYMVIENGPKPKHFYEFVIRFYFTL